MTDRADVGARWRLAALALSMLLPSLGTSIANVALPTLAASFAAPMHDVQWVVIAYLLAVTSLIVGAGRLGDLLGRRQLLLGGIGIFALASAGCLVAPNLWVLVAARGLQGAGAAIMMALTVALVGDAVPAGRTGSAMGLLGTVSAIGTALGPSLGGALIFVFGWQSVFVFMALLSTGSLLVCNGLLPADTPVRRETSGFDLGGMLLLALSLGAMALAATAGAASGPLAPLLAGAAVLGFLAFAWVERRTTSPLIELGLLRDGGLSAGLASLALVSAIVMATLVIGPFFLSGVLGLDPVRTGLVMSVGPAVAALVGVPAGRLVDRLGAARVAVAGLAGIGLGALLMIWLPIAFGVGGYVGGLALVTAGYALFQAANNTAVMAGASSGRRGVTSALLGLSRNLGLIAGASAMGAIFALGSRGIFGLAPSGATGLQLTFAVAAALAGIALALTLRAMPRLP